eukprot:TRINITY_DN2270_c0_g1_i4.p1 TRINITY_DN2270_c0_g1~~TRINITY_DN2270_c0_g1_i4.p1  ORF type:complete len:1000 (+),score=192.64 TRINITY_DN2270_c0_g1_i4:94-3093(+)
MRPSAARRSVLVRKPGAPAEPGPLQLGSDSRRAPHTAYCVSPQQQVEVNADEVVMERGLVHGQRHRQRTAFASALERAFRPVSELLRRRDDRSSGRARQYQQPAPDDHARDHASSEATEWEAARTAITTAVCATGLPPHTTHADFLLAAAEAAGDASRLADLVCKVYGHQHSHEKAVLGLCSRKRAAELATRGAEADLDLRRQRAMQAEKRRAQRSSVMAAAERTAEARQVVEELADEREMAGTCRDEYRAAAAAAESRAAAAAARLRQAEKQAAQQRVAKASIRKAAAAAARKKAGQNKIPRTELRLELMHNKQAAKQSAQAAQELRHQLELFQRHFNEVRATAEREQLEHSDSRQQESDVLMAQTEHFKHTEVRALAEATSIRSELRAQDEAGAAATQALLSEVDMLRAAARSAASETQLQESKAQRLGGKLRRAMQQAEKLQRQVDKAARRVPRVERLAAAAVDDSSSAEQPPSGTSSAPPSPLSAAWSASPSAVPSDTPPPVTSDAVTSDAVTGSAMTVSSASPTAAPTAAARPDDSSAVITGTAAAGRPCVAALERTEPHTSFFTALSVSELESQPPADASDVPTASVAVPTASVAVPTAPSLAVPFVPSPAPSAPSPVPASPPNAHGTGSAAAPCAVRSTSSVSSPARQSARRAFVTAPTVAVRRRRRRFSGLAPPECVYGVTMDTPGESLPSPHRQASYLEDRAMLALSHALELEQKHGDAWSAEVVASAQRAAESWLAAARAAAAVREVVPRLSAQGRWRQQRKWVSAAMQQRSLKVRRLRTTLGIASAAEGSPLTAAGCGTPPARSRQPQPTRRSPSCAPHQGGVSGAAACLATIQLRPVSAEAQQQESAKAQQLGEGEAQQQGEAQQRGGARQPAEAAASPGQDPGTAAVADGDHTDAKCSGSDRTLVRGGGSRLDWDVAILAALQELHRPSLASDRPGQTRPPDRRAERRSPPASPQRRHRHAWATAAEPPPVFSLTTGRKGRSKKKN